MQRNVIIHYHLFKNAGSTVDHILEREFAGRFGQIEGEHPWSVLGDAEMTDYLDANPHIACVTSHQATLYQQVPAHLNILPVLFLRHPIDRAHSVYEYEKRQTGSTSHGSRRAKELDFDGYVRWRLSPEGGAVIRNFQSRCVSGRRNPGLAATMNDAAMRDIALAHINRMQFFGIVEAFDESIAWMRSFLEPVFPGLDYRYERVNSNAGRAKTMEERLAAIEATLSVETYAALQRENAIDSELYETACRRFAAR
jgi:hypothetical protein